MHTTRAPPGCRRPRTHRPAAAGVGPLGDDAGHGGPRVNLPLGTYGQRRDASGRVIATRIRTPVRRRGRRRCPSSRPGFARITLHGQLRRRSMAFATACSLSPRATAVARSSRCRCARSTRRSHSLLQGRGARDRRRPARARRARVVGLRLGLRPLDRMGETAGAIAAGDLSGASARPTERTEVGRLGLALNAMLGQIEQAFAERQASEDRLRRFLADASHELRTPLASIRGYAELFRIGAAARAGRHREGDGAGSRRRPRGWACSSRTCSRSRGSTRCREPVREPVDLAPLAARRRRRRARDRARARDRR